MNEKRADENGSAFGACEAREGLGPRRSAQGKDVCAGKQVLTGFFWKEFGVCGAATRG
jgi:hypothetical protein